MYKIYIELAQNGVADFNYFLLFCDTDFGINGQVRNFFWFLFSRIQVEFSFSIFSPNAVKYGPEKIPYLDTFYTVGSF